MKLMVYVFILTSFFITCTGQRIELPLTIHSALPVMPLPVSSDRQSHLLFLFKIAPNKARTLYRIPLYFSNRQFAVEMIVDTGSSLLWLPRQHCLDRGRQFCGLEMGKMSYGYLDGRLRGKLITMDVFMGPETNAAKNVDCPVLLASRMEAAVRDPILGLGLSFSSEFPSFLEKLVSNGLISEPEFTFDLNAQKFYFGVEKNRPEPDITIVFAPGSVYSFSVDEISFGDLLLTRNKTTAIIDSGNTLVALPVRFLQDIISKAEKNGVKCFTKVEQNPNFFELWCHHRPEALKGLSFHLESGRIDFSGFDLFLNRCNSVGYCQTILEFHLYSGIETILGQPLFRLFTITFNQRSHQIRLIRAFKLSVDEGVDVDDDLIFSGGHVQGLNVAVPPVGSSAALLEKWARAEKV